MSSAEPTTPNRPPLQPKWIATILVLGMAYLLLRPFLVERFGWNLPGFTDVTPQPGGSRDDSEGTVSSDTVAKNRPIEVPTIPEQSEPGSDDPDLAGSDPAKKPTTKKSKPESESDSSEEPPQKPERQVATPNVGDKPKVVTSGTKPKPEPTKPPGSDGTANSPKPSVPRATNSPVAKTPVPQSDKPKLGVLRDIGRGAFESTAGLIYRSERSENRVDHVLQHSHDIPSKPVHGVFDGNREEILALIDEAYMIAQKRGPPQVVTEDQGDRETITVNLNRKIGYTGGESGARRGHPPLKKIKLVLEDRDVITAYPTN